MGGKLHGRRAAYKLFQREQSTGMTNFFHTLETYHEGKRSLDELLREIDRILNEGKDSVTSMLNALSTQNTRQPLPPPVFNAVKQRLESATEPVEKRLCQLDVVDDDTDVFSDAPTQVIQGVKPAKHRGPVNRSFSPASQSTVINSSSDNKAPLHPPNDFHIKEEGEILNGRFELKQQISTGTVYHVYRAVDLRKMEAVARDPYVAVKILKRRFSTHQAWLIALQRRVQKCQHLIHPNIGRVYDINRDGQTIYITEEYLYGQSLAQKLHTDNFEGLAPQQARPLISAMAKAFTFAHQQGITHSNFKLSKVFITDTGEIKVIDFFIPPAYGKIRAPTAETSNDSVSTPHEESDYASPERLELLNPDPRDHVFAHASIIYEMLSGHRPFSGQGTLGEREKRNNLYRPAGLKAKEWGALRRALVFERDKRTPTLERFFAEFNTKRSTMLYGLPLTTALFALAAGIVAFGMSYFFSQRYTPSFSDLTKPKNSPLAERKPEQLEIFQLTQPRGLPENTAQLRDTDPKLFAYEQLFPENPIETLANAPQLSASTKRELPAISTSTLHTEGTAAKQQHKQEDSSSKVTQQSPNQTHQSKSSISEPTPEQRSAKQQGALSKTQLDERITDLLDRAEQQIAAHELTTPEGASALQSYRQILELVPLHKGALSGIKRIEALYQELAAAAFEKGEPSIAQAYLSRAITLAPESPLLQEIEMGDQQNTTSTQISSDTEAANPRDQQLKALLTKAQRQLAIYQLTLPKGDNVAETFNQILQIDPTNRWALSGLISIANQLETRARTLKQQGDLHKCLVTVEDGLRVLPHHPGLRALKNELEDELVRRTAHADPLTVHAPEHATEVTKPHEQKTSPSTEIHLNRIPGEENSSDQAPKGEKPLDATSTKEKPLDPTRKEEKPLGQEEKQRSIKTYVTF